MTAAFCVRAIRCEDGCRRNLTLLSREGRARNLQASYARGRSCGVPYNIATGTIAGRPRVMPLVKNKSNPGWSPDSMRSGATYKSDGSCHGSTDEQYVSDWFWSGE